MYTSNVLVVDDRRENLLALESTLTGLGAHLEYVQSAEHALRYLLTNDVALILLDVQMPGINGFELAELIRQRETTQHTPIIFISAINTDQHYVFKGYSLGAVDYLTKPFEPEILRSKVLFFITLHEKNCEIKRQADLLEKANLELDELNVSLESRIRERTLELERTNEKLLEEADVRTRSQERLALEHSISRELASARDLIAAAPAILKAFCTYLRAETSALWLLSSDQASVECKHVETTRSSAAIDLFVRSCSNRKFPSGIGLPGVVWEQGSPVWDSLSGNDSRFPRAQLAAAAGFNTAIGMPIKMNDEFLGVIEFFSSSLVEIEPELLQMFEAIGREIGQFVQRQRIELERERLLTQEMTLRQQAERASRLKDEFLATVSHELRTPLNSIVGWAQIMRREALDKERREAALETIFRNSQAQAQLIDDLLDMSRLITGNFPLDLGPTSIHSVVNAAVEIVKPQARGKNIELVADLSGEDLEITCDAERIQQIVWNLLVNALKFTREGGKVEVLVDRADDHVAISVRDNGQGIEPEFLPLVFDRFRQGDSTSTRKHRGLGLGLAIVRNLAELHGGRVTAASEGLGKGAEFTLFLPLAARIDASPSIAGSESAVEEEEIGQTESASRSVPLEDVRILIVEDDADAAEMLRYALRGVGAETRNAYSVSEAIESLSEWPPSIVLSDITMPDEDGYSLIRRIRSMQLPEISGVPAIALTAMARSEDGERALSSGFHMHMPKPVDIDELTRAISSLVNGQ